jgi:hypothetical protein
LSYQGRGALQITENPSNFILSQNNGQSLRAMAPHDALLHSIGVGCGGCWRGGIGTEQQGIEPGFDSGEPFVLLLQLFDIVLDQLRSPLALELSDLRVDGWMPV